MAQSTKASSCRANPRAKGPTNTDPSITTTSKLTQAHGSYPSPTVSAGQPITTATSTKASLSKAKDAGQAPIGSTRYTSIPANGSTTASGARANCTRTTQSSFRACSRRGSSMGSASSSTKTGTTSRATTLRTRREARASTISVRGESWSRSSTPVHPRYPRFT